MLGLFPFQMELPYLKICMGIASRLPRILKMEIFYSKMI